MKLLKDRCSHVHSHLGEANTKEQPALLAPKGTLQNFAIGLLRQFCFSNSIAVAVHWGTDLDTGAFTGLQIFSPGID